MRQEPDRWAVLVEGPLVTELLGDPDAFRRRCGRTAWSPADDIPEGECIPLTLALWPENPE